METNKVKLKISYRIIGEGSNYDDIKLLYIDVDMSSFEQQNANLNHTIQEEFSKVVPQHSIAQIISIDFAGAGETIKGEKANWGCYVAFTIGLLLGYVIFTFIV